MRPGCLRLDGGEVKFGTKVKFRSTKQVFTCMNLCSGSATIGLVAEVTGLTGKQVHEVGSEHETNVWSENINDIIRTS